MPIAQILAVHYFYRFINIRYPPVPRCRIAVALVLVCRLQSTAGGHKFDKHASEPKQEALLQSILLQRVFTCNVVVYQAHSTITSFSFLLGSHFRVLLSHDCGS